MRRRHEESLDVWPAFTDFITSLSFVLIFVLVSLVYINHDVLQKSQQLEEQRKQLEQEKSALQFSQKKLQEQLLSKRLESEVLALHREQFKQYFEQTRPQHAPSKAELFQLQSRNTDRVVLRIHFAVGDASITDQGRRDLQLIAPVLMKKFALFDSIEVEGHSDDQALSPGGLFASNWELSAARAGTVVRFLRDQFPTRLPPWKIKATGRSMYCPSNWEEQQFAQLKRNQVVQDPPYVKAANDTATLQDHNRRIEILLNYRNPTDREMAEYKQLHR